MAVGGNVISCDEGPGPGRLLVNVHGVRHGRGHGMVVDEYPQEEESFTGRGKWEYSSMAV